LSLHFIFIMQQQQMTGQLLQTSAEMQAADEYGFIR
jgi:hypothetical protein